MKPLLLLVDAQHDFLRAPGLEPAPGEVIEHAATLLQHCRAQAIPVAHVWTTLRRDDDRRMPHWRARGIWRCLEGTDGHAAPTPLRPTAGEPVFHKTFFSAFEDPDLDALIDRLGADTVWLAGVHLHGCIRATALDAYARGLAVCIADDAVASDDPVHAAITRRYLADRTIRFVRVRALLVDAKPARNGTVPDELPAAIVDGQPRSGASDLLVHAPPRRPDAPGWAIPIGLPEQVAEAAASARHSLAAWQRVPAGERAAILDRLADRLERDAPDTARLLADEIGKPVRYAEGEARATAAMLRAIARRAEEAEEAERSASAWVRRRPLGVVALVTPWNNPLYIPLGKLAPALLFGNAVVWKPAPAGAPAALRLLEALAEAGLPSGLVNLVNGDAATTRALLSDPGIDAVTLTGGVQAGYAAQELCARRGLPLQAELGGNNAAIVWADADLETAASQIAEGAFAQAGQRCTANRRAIVDARCYDAFTRAVTEAAGALGWGDPRDPETQIGPLISQDHRVRVAAAIARAASVAEIVVPAAHRAGDLPPTYHPPTLVCCDDAGHEIVQEETFGPVLVVQRAEGWDHALALCNGVRQGLAAALFSPDPGRQAQFLAEAQAGILKINQSTAGADLDVPFGGWKASGIGPPEHGTADRDFYTRPQTVYATHLPVPSTHEAPHDS